MSDLLGKLRSIFSGKKATAPSAASSAPSGSASGSPSQGGYHHRRRRRRGGRGRNRSGRPGGPDQRQGSDHYRSQQPQNREHQPQHQQNREQYQGPRAPAPAADLSVLQEAMGYHFKDAKILIEALTHPSYAYESLIPNAPDFNRLEFLGDGVIGMIVAENLYRERPNADEGDLTRQRSLIVSREALAKRAVTLGVGAYVFVGKGEEKTGGRTNMTNLSAVIEALIGAVYIDGGLEAARAFIARACV